MSLSTLKPARCVLPPIAAENGTHLKLSKVKMVNRQALPSLQVTSKERPQQQETSTATTSRREILSLAAASLCFVPSYAEARPRNATMRQKIMEKFEELRQKAGLSKPKDETAEKKPNSKNGTEEKKPKAKDYGEKKPVIAPQHSVVPPKEEPSLPNILNGKTVETTLP